MSTYPDDETLQKIKEWSFEDIRGWFDFIEMVLPEYGSFTRDADCPYKTTKIATGGWSGCESIMAAMRRNYVCWGLTWQSSHRGGLFVFTLEDMA